MDAATTIRDVRLSRSLFLVGIVILFYDHLLTLGPEIQYIWTTKHKRNSSWFLFIRYFSFAGNILMALDTFGDFGNETCGKLRIITGFIIVVQEFIIGCALFLRVYAMYGLSKKILLLLVITGAIIVSLGAWSIVPVGMSPILASDAPGCYLPQLKAQSDRIGASWTAELAGDIMVFVLTLHRAYTQTVRGSSFTGMLWRILIRDGLVYFGIICLVNTANICMFFFGDIYTANSLSWFTSAISVAMILRLMLNLHAAAAPVSEQLASTDLELQTFRVARRRPRAGTFRSSSTSSWA
ncbi:hypothetical protein C8R46DRAFT_1087513 [Mycena filopes]|nr:hypothetical protein C8R46DRAFT_1087513 [Mycena filopes]